MNPLSFRNEPADFLPEALGGFVASHPNIAWNNAGFLHRDGTLASRVQVISGGGSGHEPLHASFIGEGMLAAACPGLMFTSPNAVQITEATRWADQGPGVVHVVKNYTGDVMNFQVARHVVEREGIRTRHVLVRDDVATEQADGPGRRGTGATVLVEKVCGAAAARGDSLDEVVDIGQWLADHSRSMAVALAPGHLPTTGQVTFDLPSGQMELGVGIHGERGTSRMPAQSASQIVDTLLTTITEAMEFGPEVVVLVNGLGGTHSLELNLVYGQVVEWFARCGVQIVRGLVGDLVTAVNMAGVSITVAEARSDVLELLDSPTDAPGWPREYALPAEYRPARISADDRMPTGEPNEWLTGFLTRVQASIDELTELDRQAGDGDFGQNMEAAFGGVDLPVRGSDADVLEALAQRLFIRSGGTSGAVLGTLFHELAVANSMAEGLARAQDAIHALGGAEPGDNTVIDAIAPAALAARNGQDIAAAAHEGAQSTKDMVAKKGRASYVGDAARGVVDPGALLVSWLLAQ